MRFSHVINAIVTVAKNIFLSINVISLSLLMTLKRMVDYITESLFIYHKLFSKNAITKKNVFQALPGSSLETIELGNLGGSETWFTEIASYTADIISLSLICKIIKPKVVFEIGTFEGYTSFHFALNTPDDAKIYTLDLPKFENPGVSKLETSIMDDAYIRASSKVRKYLF